MKKFSKNNKNKDLVFVSLIFLFWFILVFAISLLSDFVLPFKASFAYTGVGPKILWKRANFDGIHYLLIAQNGYGTYQQAFFPLYPILIRKLSFLFNRNFLFTGFFISNFSFFLALLVFYKLIKLDYEEKVAKAALLFLICFSTSFFFGSIYTESLFLLLILLSFYSARKRNFLLSGVFGALASSTRIVGIFLFPALIFEFYQQKEEKKPLQVFPSLLGILLVPVGLGLYMKYLWMNYKDPFLFFRVQPFFGAQRSDKIILLYQVFWRYLKMILTTKIDILYFIVWEELLFAILFLVLLAVAYKNRVRHSYLIFSVLAFVAPTITGTFSSLPRYVLVLFPTFIVLGQIQNKFLKKILLFIFAFIGIVNAILFFQGYWVS